MNGALKVNTHSEICGKYKIQSSYLCILVLSCTVYTHLNTSHEILKRAFAGVGKCNLIMVLTVFNSICTGLDK